MLAHHQPQHSLVRGSGWKWEKTRQLLRQAVKQGAERDIKDALEGLDS